MAIKPEIIKETLKSIGLIKEKQLAEALREQKETRERLGLILVKKGYIKDEDIRNAVMTQLGIRPEETRNVHMEPEILRRAPSAFVHHHRVVPIKIENNTLTLATDNPFNFLAFENFKHFLGCEHIEGVLTTERDITALLEKYYSLKEETPINTFLAGMDKRDTALLKDATEKKLPPKEKEEEEETPIIKLVSLLIAEAFKRRASDIHLEPLGQQFRVRYRIDGVLQETPGPPKRLQGSVISRVKIMAEMDIAERRLPQDGRIRVTISGRPIDLRVSTLPAVYGESVVLRILDKSSFIMGLKELGFHADDHRKFERLIKMPNGIILVTGPTGSGKTTTLYACLSHINRSDKKIITVEDPVEYQISGINQVQIRPQINLTFANGLRSILRQAPDVIMVGEIRDFETAQIAVQASLTGHLVFSTLHTNDAPGAVTRLIDMGVKPYLVASALQAVLAQRLVRVICVSCKEQYRPSPEELQAINLPPEQLKKAKFHRGKGCKNCSYTGYKGRIAIFELLIMTDTIRELVFGKVSSSVIKRKAKEIGMVTLREDGIRKVLQGITTISEVMRVTQQDVV